MKNIIRNIFVGGVLSVIAFASCQSEYTVYSGPEYVMFADTAAIYPVMIEEEYFEVPVVSTTTCDYDRTFGVEVIDKQSNALERYHYRLKSNTVTIKAGQTRGNVYVKGVYDNIQPEDSLAFTLSLVMPEELESPLYGIKTRVELRKSCPFDINAFTGWCVVTSQFLYDFSQNGWYQRLVRTEKLASEDNTIVCKNWLYDGYDIVMKFNPEDPANPLATIAKDQVVSDEGSVFGIAYGDNHILVSTIDAYPSYFYSCLNTVAVYAQFYVEDIGESYGTVGIFYNIMEWISDEEAYRLHIEDGMPGYYNVN